jgi:hypothetical protein
MIFAFLLIYFTKTLDKRYQMYYIIYRNNEKTKKGD